VAAGCQVRLLGGFSVELDGRAVPERAWPSGDAADLVKVLALDIGHHVGREDVVSRLWPTLSRHEAARALHHAVKEVRRALHDERAVTEEADSLRLWPHGELHVDAHAFAAAARHARLPDQRAAAAALYAGDLLPDDERPWTEPLRTRLRLAHLELLRDPDGSMPAWIDLRELTVD